MDEDGPAAACEERIEIFCALGRPIALAEKDDRVGGGPLGGLGPVEGEVDGGLFGEREKPAPGLAPARVIVFAGAMVLGTGNEDDSERARRRRRVRRPGDDGGNFGGRAPPRRPLARCVDAHEWRFGEKKRHEVAEIARAQHFIKLRRHERDLERSGRNNVAFGRRGIRRPGRVRA